MSRLSDALGNNPLVISGNGRRAYNDKNIAVQGVEGELFSLQEIVEYVYEVSKGGEGGPGADGNGIYSGSGNVPSNTVATLQGLFRIVSSSSGETIASALQISKLASIAAALIQYEIANQNNWSGIRTNLNLHTIIRAGSGSIILQTAKGKANQAGAGAPLVALNPLGDKSGHIEFADFTLPSAAPGAGNRMIEWQNGTPVFVNTPSGGGASVAFDALTSGNVSAQVTRIGGTATTIANPAAGEYNFVVQSGAHLNAISLFGNNTTLNASNEMIIRINNAANARNRRVLVQLFDAQNGALVDQQATATVHTQSVSGNISVITIPGLNGFGAAGFWVEIR